MEDGAQQHRDIVVLQWRAFADEGARREQQRSGPGQAQREACRQRGGRPIELPQQGRERQEPDQYREIHVHHERGVEEILPGQPLPDARRARRHQQQGQQPGGDEGIDAQHQPGARLGSVMRFGGRAHGVAEMKSMSRFRLFDLPQGVVSCWCDAILQFVPVECACRPY